MDGTSKNEEKEPGASGSYLTTADTLIALGPKKARSSIKKNLKPTFTT